MFTRSEPYLSPEVLTEAKNQILIYFSNFTQPKLGNAADGPGKTSIIRIRENKRVYTKSEASTLVGKKKKHVKQIRREQNNDGVNLGKSARVDLLKNLLASCMSMRSEREINVITVAIARRFYSRIAVLVARRCGTKNLSFQMTYLLGINVRKDTKTASSHSAIFVLLYRVYIYTF